jgi:glycosyltransferase involved in cell wall biosynthesis
MRICFIIHQASKEGAGRFLLDQIDYLKKKNVVVYVIVPTLGPLCEALSQREVEFKIVENPWWTKGSFTSSTAGRAFMLVTACAMADLFLKWKIDIIYTQTIVAPAGALASAMIGKPHIWHIHEFSYNPECIEMAIPQLELAQLLNLTSNWIVFNSSAVAAEWRDWLPPAKMKIVRNWLNPKTISENETVVSGFRPAGNNPFKIAMVASILPWKRQMDAVQATAKLIRENLDVCLSVVGPLINEKYRDDIIAFIDEHKLQDRIHLLGYMENPESVVKSSQATVVCSRLEPFGRVTIESMAQGVPVVGANSGGTREIIEDEVNGLLYPVGDIDALANQLSRLVQDENFRQKLSKNAIRRAEQFSSAEREMEPLLALLSAIRGTPNPSWPLGEMLGAHMSAELKNSRNLSAHEHINLLFGKLKRRIKNLITAKSQANVVR